MSGNKTDISGRSGAREIVVWDPLVRLIHWGLALAILLNGTIIDAESNIHEWIGYAAVSLACVRLVWGLVGSRSARFSAFPPNLFSAIRHLKGMFKEDKTVHLSHNPLGALMVYNIWATVLFMGVTGYMMGTHRFFGVGWVEEVHEAAFDWLVLSVVLHVAGVLFESWRTGVPLIKSMINGRKNVPAERQVE